MDTEFRRGFVKIDNRMFDDLQNNSTFGKVFFSNFFICNIHHGFNHKLIGCKSEYFDEIEESNLIPIYDIIFKRLENNVTIIDRVEKLDEVNLLAI